MEQSIDQVPAKQNRKYYLDVLRFTACLCIITIHCTGFFVVENFGSLNFWIGNILDSAARMGVPLFVMISGALLLDENHTVTVEGLKKRIVRMLLFLAFWSAVYSVAFCVIAPLTQHKAVDIKEAVSSFLTADNHLWFMYMIIGLYLIIPLLRLWVKKMNVGHVRYFLLLALIFSFVLPQIKETLGFCGKTLEYPSDVLKKILDNICFKYAVGYSGYFVLGWYLNNYEIKHKKHLYALGIVSVAATAYATWAFSKRANESIAYYSYLYVGVLLEASAVFVLIKTLFGSKEPGSSLTTRIVMFVSKYSLGVYAIHAAIVTCLHKGFLSFGVGSAAIEVPIVFVAALGLGLLGSYVFSKIPLLKKVV